jgi:hypothetical protein
MQFYALIRNILEPDTNSINVSCVWKKKKGTHDIHNITHKKQEIDGQNLCEEECEGQIHHLFMGGIFCQSEASLGLLTFSTTTRKEGGIITQEVLK